MTPFKKKIYIYIYIYRERERERERGNSYYLWEFRFSNNTNTFNDINPKKNLKNLKVRRKPESRIHKKGWMKGLPYLSSLLILMVASRFKSLFFFSFTTRARHFWHAIHCLWSRSLWLFELYIHPIFEVLYRPLQKIK